MSKSKRSQAQIKAELNHDQKRKELSVRYGGRCSSDEKALLNEAKTLADVDTEKEAIFVAVRYFIDNIK